MPAITCQAVGCACARKSSQFMCTPHWKALPLPLRRQVNATWGAYRAATGDARSEAWIDYIAARDEAQRWTAEGEGRLGQFTADAPRLRALAGLRKGRS